MGLIFLYLAASKHIRDLADGDKRLRVDIADDGFHLVDLKAIDNEIDDGLFLIGISARDSDLRRAALEFLQKRSVDLLRVIGHDHNRLGAVNTFDNKVDRFKPRAVRHDGIERQDPAFHDDAADDVQKHVVDHHERSDGDIQTLREDDRHDLNTVDRAAVADGKTAADARDNTAEKCTQQKVFPCKGRGHAHIDRQNVADHPRRPRVDGNRENGVDCKRPSLLFKAKKKKWDVQKQKEYRKRPFFRRDL